MGHILFWFWVYAVSCSNINVIFLFYSYLIKQVLYGKTYQLYSISSMEVYKGGQPLLTYRQLFCLTNKKTSVKNLLIYVYRFFTCYAFTNVLGREKKRNSPVVVFSSTWFGMQLVFFTCIDCFPPSPKLFFVQDRTRYSLWMWCQIIYCYTAYTAWDHSYGTSCEKKKKTLMSSNSFITSVRF